MDKLRDILCRLSETNKHASNAISGAGSGNISLRRGAEAIFISGIAGSGKTHLAHRFGTFLSGSGWIVVKAKFERGTEHSSQVGARDLHSIFQTFMPLGRVKCYILIFYTCLTCDYIFS